MGNYHPHGDSAIYDALVRMAQDFSLRYPLVDGQGNFGSLDGDAAASMRYTECKLQKIGGRADRRDRLQDRRVAARTTTARATSRSCCRRAFPNLLVNGSQGIAVGMATSIPPHNLGEVIEACIALVDDAGARVEGPAQVHQGARLPDGRPGARVASATSRRSTRPARARSSCAASGRSRSPRGAKQTPTIVITSIPYGPTKQSIVEKIGEIIRERKLPQMVDVRDQSTTDVRIVLEIKKDADPALIMAYLYKNTPLQTNVQVNLTCLVPTDNPEVGRPERLNLQAAACATSSTSASKS